MSHRGGGRSGGGARYAGGKREQPPPQDEQQPSDAKRARHLPSGAPRHGGPTVRDLITDTLAPLANAYWAPGRPVSELRPFDPAIIETIYAKHLAPTNEKAEQRAKREEEEEEAKKGEQEDSDDELRQLRAAEEKEQAQLEAERTHRLLLLELSAYLENYLWRHYTPATATFAHVMSIVMLLNEKFKGDNRVGIWEPFRSRPQEILTQLLERISKLKTERDLSLLEANQLLLFFIHAFESFEEPAVRAVFMRLASIDAWRSLRETTILRELRTSDEASSGKGSDLRSVWPRIAAKPSSDFAAAFLPNLLTEFVHILYSIDSQSRLFRLDTEARTVTTTMRRLPYALRDLLLYLERFLEFVIGLLAKRSTRRWTKKLLEEAHLLVLCEQSPLVQCTRTKEREIEQAQEAMAARGRGAGSDAMDMEVLSASTATAGGAILSTNNHSNTNNGPSVLSLPGRLFCQLLGMAAQYVRFEVDDVTGEQLAAQEVLNRHYLDVQILQKICFKFFGEVPQLRAIALANVSRIDDAEKLADMLQGVTSEQLHALAVALQLLPREEEVQRYQKDIAAAAPASKKKAAAAPAHVPRLIMPLLGYMRSSSFLLSLLQSHLVLRPSTLSSIQNMPLYPNERLLFDEHAIPSINYTGDSVLALPKLNLQFLTTHDYLLRNFQLYQGESTYEIREDIAYTLKRLKPRVANDGNTLFTGWARMACPLVSFAVTGVMKPLIGESKPSAVRAEITIDLSVFNGIVREEWEQLREHDVLFLLAVQALTPIDAPSAQGAMLRARQMGDSEDRFKGRKKTDVELADLREAGEGQAPEEAFHAMLQEPFLVRYVRGAEVKCVLDGYKRIIGERDDKGNVYKARGHVRTFRVELDAAQYLLDQRAEIEGRPLNGGSPVSAVYSSFNLLLRRKPKENNFKGVLSTIRDVMADTHAGLASLPSWLSSVFLGYGDPRDSQYYTQASQLATVEFIDTFIDLQHLRDSFHEQVQLAERSSDDIEAEMRGEKQLSLVAIGGEANNRQTAAATAIQLTRQVMRLVAQAQKEKQAKLAGAATPASAAPSDPNTASSTFRITFPLKVAPNYEILQKLLYARGAATAASSEAPENVLAAGAEVVRAQRKLLAKKKVLPQDAETEEGEVEEGELEDDAAMDESVAATAPEQTGDSEPVAPAPFTQQEPVFDMAEPVKPAAAGAAGDAAAVPADVEAEIVKLSHLTVVVLKERLKELELKTDGKKADLVERLSEALREKAKAAAPAGSAAPAAAGADDTHVQYEKDLSAYREAKAKHEDALRVFREAEKAHRAATAAYEAELAKSSPKKSPKKASTKKSPAKGKKAEAATEAEEAEMVDEASPAKKKRGGSRKKKQDKDAEEADNADASAAAAPADSAAPAASSSSAADIPPSPHILSVELLPRVHARHDYVRRNHVRFTPTQVEAIKSGVQPGLTTIVGPPGTGKTDVAVQIISEIYHNFPDQRTLLITHSNNALNDLFAKIMERDIDERYLLRLGRGAEDIATESDMSKFGRVNYMLQRRLTLLEEVARLARSLGMTDDVAYTCETSGHFFLAHVLSRWEKFVSTVQQAERASAADLESLVHRHFPFAAYFQERVDKSTKIWEQYYAQQSAAAAFVAAPAAQEPSAMEVDGASSGAPAGPAAAPASAVAPAVPTTLFRGTSFTEDMSIAVSCFADLQQTFVELEETRPFELLRTYKDRSNYLLSKHAKIIAMTCTHAAIKRADLVELGFRFDNLVMEEAAQILEIETFIPMLLQRNDSESGGRLKRICLLGDHHQLPPVIKNRAFQRFSHLDQSLFTRFIRLGMPFIQLNAQGRMRASLAALWNWQYKDLGNLPFVQQHPAYVYSNVGFAHEFQLINVEDLNGVGESAPTPFFYQNLAEAEYIVQTYMYMRLLGYPASRITILTTYNGQKHLIRDVLAQRCANNPLFGLPAKVSTVDKYQGQQNDFILLSLVRTRTVGHLRDVRRLVVAMSRARLGIYVFGRVSLFSNCFELTRTFNQLLHKPIKLQLLPQEKRPIDTPLMTTRLAAGVPPPPGAPPASEAPAVLEVRDVVHMGELVGSMTLSVQSEFAEYQRRIYFAQQEEARQREMRELAQRQYEEARERTRQEDARLAALAARDAEHARENERLERELAQQQEQEPAASAASAAASPDEDDSESDNE